MLSRRQFLGRGATCLALGGAMPSLFARAAAAAAKADRDDRVLVVIELNGGNDGLNTVIPHGNDLYYKLRPSLAIGKNEVVRLNDKIGLPAGMSQAAELFKNGKLTIMQGVGYPKQDRSHFRSLEIWHTASTAARAPSTGWLGRVLDYQDRADAEQLLPGLALGDSLPQAFQAAKRTVPVVQQISDLSGTSEPSSTQKLLYRLSTLPRGKKGATSFLARQTAATYRVEEQLRRAASKFAPEGDHPSALKDQLRRGAQFIASGLGVRLLFASQPGYDTHKNQAGDHQKLLGELADALADFQHDLEQRRVADRVLVLAFSEFGRRVQPNASAGTDHGAASCLFLAGAPVKGGVAGTYPRLDQLDEGDLIYNVDFRSVYATVLEKWLGCPAEKLLGQKFPMLDLLR